MRFKEGVFLVGFLVLLLVVFSLGVFAEEPVCEDGVCTSNNPLEDEGVESGASNDGSESASTDSEKSYPGSSEDSGSEGFESGPVEKGATFEEPAESGAEDEESSSKGDSGEGGDSKDDASADDETSGDSNEESSIQDEDCREIQKDEGKSKTSSGESERSETNNGESEDEESTKEVKKAEDPKELTSGEEERLKAGDGDVNDIRCRMNQIAKNSGDMNALVGGFFKLKDSNGVSGDERRNAVWDGMSKDAKAKLLEAFGKGDLFKGAQNEQGVSIVMGADVSGSWEGKKFTPEGMREIDFAALSKFTKGDFGGKENGFTYGGNHYKGKDFSIDEIHFDEEGYVVKLSNNGEFRVKGSKGGLNFGDNSAKKLQVIYGDSGSNDPAVYDVKMARGIVEMNDEGLYLRMVAYDDFKTASGFPILNRKVNGVDTDYSVFQGAASGVSKKTGIPNPDNPWEYNIWQQEVLVAAAGPHEIKGNAVFSVDFRGKVRRIYDAKINSDGTVERMYARSSLGEVFSTDARMHLHFGKKPSSDYNVDKNGNAMWAWSEGGKSNVKLVIAKGSNDFAVFSHVPTEGDTNGLKSAFGTVELIGDSMFKSGSALFSGTLQKGFTAKNGLFIRKIVDGGIETAYDFPISTIDKIFGKDSSSGFKVTLEQQASGAFPVLKSLAGDAVTEFVFSGDLSKALAKYEGIETTITDGLAATIGDLKETNTETKTETTETSAGSTGSNPFIPTTRVYPIDFDTEGVFNSGMSPNDYDRVLTNLQSKKDPLKPTIYYYGDVTCKYCKDFVKFAEKNSKYFNIVSQEGSGDKPQLRVGNNDVITGFSGETLKTLKTQLEKARKLKVTPSKTGTIETPTKTVIPNERTCGPNGCGR